VVPDAAKKSYKSRVISFRRSSALLRAASSLASGLRLALPLIAVAVSSLAFEPAAAAAPSRAGATAKEDEESLKPADPAAPKADDSEKEGLRAVYISGDLGYTRPDVGALSNNTGFDKTAAGGLLAGIGIGYRWRELRFGARFRDTSTTQFNLWSLMGEVGYALPFRPISPFIFLHAGYMFDSGIQRSVVQSSLPETNALTPNVHLEGLVVGAELGASYWVTKFLRLGPFVGFDLTFLHRDQVDLPQSILPLSDQTKNNPLFSGSGNGTGYIFSIGIRATGDISF
jgi:hypothetical protein